jgi:hypothetical protein
MQTKFSYEYLKDHFGDTSIDGTIFELLLKKIRCECVDWVQLTQDKDHCRVLVNTCTFYVFVVRCFEFTQGT